MKFFDSLLGKKNAARPEEANAPLVRAMHEVALSDNPENRQNLYMSLLESMLLVPVPEIPAGLAPGLQTTKENVKLQLTGMLDREQRRITPAFTDEAALRNFDPNTPYLGIRAQELFKFCMGTDIEYLLINPFDPIRKMIRPGGQVTRAEMDVLAKGIIPTRIGPKGVQFQVKTGEIVFIGRPATPLSPNVEESIKAAAQDQPEISELYLIQMATPSGTSQTVIGIGLTTGMSRTREDELAAALGETVQPQLAKGQSLDFLVLRGNIAQEVRARGALIFRR